MEELTELNQILKQLIYASGKRFGIVKSCGCEISDIGLKFCLESSGVQFLIILSDN